MNEDFKNVIQRSISTKHTKYIILFFYLTCSFSGEINAQEIVAIKSTIMNESKLSILGTSNVTDFECLYDNDFRIDTLSHYLALDQGIIKVSGDTLKLIIENFDCGKRGINKDFRSSLKSDEYPSIDISLISFKQSNRLLKEVNVLISLAGSEKIFELEFTSSYLENGLIKIEGEQKLTMSDFNITPPRALLGLIKVRDELTIKFELLLKTI